jgi:hypothetical protein
MSGAVDKFLHILSRHGQEQLFLLSQLKSEWLSWYGVCAAGRSTVQYSTIQYSTVWVQFPAVISNLSRPKRSDRLWDSISTLSSAHRQISSRSQSYRGIKLMRKFKKDGVHLHNETSLSARCGLQCQSIRF